MENLDDGYRMTDTGYDAVQMKEQRGIIRVCTIRDNIRYGTVRFGRVDNK